MIGIIRSFNFEPGQKFQKPIPASCQKQKANKKKSKKNKK